MCEPSQFVKTVTQGNFRDTGLRDISLPQGQIGAIEPPESLEGEWRQAESIPESILEVALADGGFNAEF